MTTCFPKILAVLLCLCNPYLEGVMSSSKIYYMSTLLYWKGPQVGRRNTGILQLHVQLLLCSPGLTAVVPETWWYSAKGLENHVSEEIRSRILPSLGFMASRIIINSLILCIIFIFLPKVDYGQGTDFRIVANDVSWAKLMHSVTSLLLMGLQQTMQLPSLLWGCSMVWIWEQAEQRELRRCVNEQEL